MPIPTVTRSRSSNGDHSRSVNPDPWSAFQKRLPGRAKWCPTAPEYSPGLIPTNTTRRRSARRSGIARPRAASSCSGVGRLDGLPDRPIGHRGVMPRGTRIVPSRKGSPTPPRNAGGGWRSRPVSRILCAALTRRRRPSVSVGRSRARRVAVRPRRAATRKLGRAALERSLLALLRTGVAEPRRSPAALVGSYPTVSPLPLRRSAEAVCFLLPLREVAPAWLSPASCPAESGLSSPRADRTGARPPGRLLQPRRYRVSGRPRSATRRHLRWRAGPPRRSACAARARTGSVRTPKRALGASGAGAGGGGS